MPGTVNNRLVFARSCVFIVFCLCACVLAADAGQSAREAELVYRVGITGSINPGSAELLKRALRESVRDGAACLLVELDTPGGLVSTLRDMIQGVMASPVPVIVYVSPPGAQAASAGALLTLSAHVAAMAPGTNIGAAHPVRIGDKGGKDETMSLKAENDLAAMARSIAEERGRNAEWAEKAVRKSVSASAAEAWELGVVDILASDLSDLLRQVDGREVNVSGKITILTLKDPEVVDINENIRERILKTIADPNIAYILMMIGVTGLYFELAHPGAVFPGTVGAICLVLGLYALQALPVSMAGILLLALAMILFVLELVVTSAGILGAAGLVSLLLGSLMLFDTPRTGIAVSAEVLWPTFVGVALFLAAVTWLATRATLQRPRSGVDALVGKKGVVKKQVGPEGGTIYLDGEIWTAASDAILPEQTEVTVTAVDGLKLRVKKTGEDES